MLLPVDAQCRLILDEMATFDPVQLTKFELDFLSSNTRRTYFTDRQKEIIKGFCNKYVFTCMKGYQ